MTEDARLTYTNGGHNPPLLLRALPPGVSARAITERVLSVLEEFAGGVEPADDQTLLVLCVR